jgi:hypothetical protein
MDVRPQQNPQAWLTAKGFAPTSLFRANPGRRPRPRGDGVGDAVNIEVATSQIDLGIVQGFTSP